MSNLLVALDEAALDVDRIAYSFEGNEGTYRELNEHSNRIANKFLKDGFKNGDHFAMLMGNDVNFIATLYGIWKIGGVVIPINPTYTRNEIAYILMNANVKSVIMIPQVEEVINSLIPDIESLEKTYVLNEEFWEELSKFPTSIEIGTSIESDNVAVILYTSGTTGKPKGALLSHRNLYCNAMDTGRALEINSKDVVLVALPMFHIFALTVCVNMPIVTKAKMVIMRQFSPKEFLRLVDEEKVTFFGGVPTMYNFVYHYIKENPRALSTITHCASGGASLQVSIIEAYQKEFNITIQEGYGLSEGAGVVTLNPRRGEIKAGTVGFAIGQYVPKIVDEEGNEVPVGTVGELICKGDNVFLGYYQLPEATEAALRDGWLYTGDLAVSDESGYISIVDRKKDLIIVGGYNVYPREVEEVLYRHEKVIEAGVIGEMDEVYGQKVVAFITGKNGLTKEEVIHHCKQHLTSYKIPTEIHFLEELPKTSSGKILKKNLSIKGAIR